MDDMAFFPTVFGLFYVLVLFRQDGWSWCTFVYVKAYRLVLINEKLTPHFVLPSGNCWAKREVLGNESEFCLLNEVNAKFTECSPELRRFARNNSVCLR